MKILQAWNKTNLPDKYYKTLSDPSVQFPLPIEVVANNIVELLEAVKVWPNGRLWLLNAYVYKDKHLPYKELYDDVNES